MAWKDREINNLNRQMSNVMSARGRMEKLSGFLFQDGGFSNYLISGGVDADERYLPLFDWLDYIVGQIPMVILHNRDIHLEAMVNEAWHRAAEGDYTEKLWTVNDDNPFFEPFYGMTDMQITMILRQLAKRLDYTVTPRFERVVNAHLSILKELEIPYSLSGLFYLCQFQDIGEFHDNIMALPCGEASARRIWAELGTEDERGSEQFDLFRAIINNLAMEAQYSGWSPDSSIGEYNCVQAVQSGAVFLLSLDNMHNTLMHAYLAEELKINSHTPFFLMLDDITVKDDGFFEYLCSAGDRTFIGIISENAVEQLGQDEAAFQRLADKMDCLVLLKHSTGKTAEVLSEIIGKYDYTKAETSSGTSRGFFHFMPRDTHDDIRISTENRYRVMPESITGLQAGQAIIFDVVQDLIIFYN